MSNLSAKNMNIKKLPLSVSLITKNEEKRLGHTLSCIADIAEEIVIIDSGSTDNTEAIAENYNAKFIYNKWNGFAEQKNISLSHCSKKWILCLDADEEITDELKDSIIKVIEADENYTWSFNRKTFYAGKLLNHSWQPDKKVRLVKRSSNPSWSGGLIHEELNSDFPVRLLAGNVIHYSYFDIFHHYTKTIEYSKISAENYHQKGKKFSIGKLIFNPIIALVKSYFLRHGFMDGVRGIAVSFSYMANTFLKYLFLWEIENKKKAKKQAK